MEENTQNQTVEQELEERLSACTEFYATEYERVAEELRFIGGDMWTKEIRKGRGRNRLELKQNVLRPYRDRIVNPLRLHPLGGNVNGRQGIIEPLKAKIRQVEQDSRHDEVANAAFDDAVSGGYGWMEIEIKQAKNGKLKAAFKRPGKDPVSVMLDPSSVEIDGSDAWFAFKVGSIPVSRAVIDFGQADYTGSFSGISTASGRNYAQSLTYYRRTDNGVEVYHYVGRTLVYKAEMPIDWLPIWPVYGDSYRREDDQYYYSGIVKWAKDSQILVNYYKSQEAERIGKAPKAQWLIEREQKGENEEQWLNPNRYDTLVWDQIAGTDGKPLPEPKRMDNTANTMDLQGPYASAVADTGRVLGMPDAMMGVDPESLGESGKAVLARQSHAEIATAHYMDHIRKSIEHGTRILIQLIPKLAVEPELIYVSSEDGEEQEVMVDWNDPSINWDEINVDIASGPAYASKRKEDTDTMIESIKLNPQIAPMVMDIVLRQQDSAGAKEMAKRLKLMLPPQLQPQKGQDAPDPQAMQALQAAQQATQAQEQEITAMREMISQLQAALIAEESKNKVTLAVKEMEVQKDLTLGREGNLVKLEIARISSGSKLAETTAKEGAATNRKVMELDQKAEESQQNLVVNALQVQHENATKIEDRFEEGLPQSNVGLAPGGLMANI